MIEVRQKLRSLLLFLLLFLLTPELPAKTKLISVVPPRIKGALYLWGGRKLSKKSLKNIYSTLKNKKLLCLKIGAVENIINWDSSKCQLTTLNIISRDQANNSQHVKTLRDAEAIWVNGSISDIKRILVGSALEQQLFQNVSAGKVVGGKLNHLNVYPFITIDSIFLKNEKDSAAVKKLNEKNGRLGLGIPANSLLLLKGRKARVLEGDKVITCLPASKYLKSRRVKFGTISAKTKRKTDLFALCRAAIARRISQFPLSKADIPYVAHGTLIIVGGGAMHSDIMNTFLEKAGGKDVPFVVIPLASPSKKKAQECGGYRSLKKAGATDITVLFQKGRRQVNTKQFARAIHRAKGIWFGGGRQWHIVDAYENTQAQDLFEAFLKRGGVIGGTSAGASIQGEYMCRGDPEGPRAIIAEGYELGLGFLNSVGIDQHFSQRQRFKDMTLWSKVFPQLLGFGIDESTAIVVEKHQVKVIGRGQVSIYNSKDEPTKGKDYLSLKAGDHFDLKTRKQWK
jgi:cyanophycinase